MRFIIVDVVYNLSNALLVIGNDVGSSILFSLFSRWFWFYYFVNLQIGILLFFLGQRQWLLNEFNFFLSSWLLQQL